MPARPRRMAAICLGAYALFLAAVLLAPSPAVPIDVVARLSQWLTGAGASAASTVPSRLEFLLNAAMFSPVVLLAAITFPRHPWANWVVYGFVGSAAVELLQGILLPARSAQFADVVANTSGALLGAVIAIPVVAHLGSRREP